MRLHSMVFGISLFLAQFSSAAYGANSLVARHSNKCVDVAGGSQDSGANVQQYTCNGSDAQKFRIEAAPNGGYRAINVGSGKCLDVAGGSPENGANIQQWDCNGSAAQSFQLIPDDGSLKFKFHAGGRCMDVGGFGYDDGQNILQWDCIDNADNQEFYLAP